MTFYVSFGTRLPTPDATVLDEVRGGVQRCIVLAGPTVTRWIGASVEWRPDGKVLAAILPPKSDGGATPWRVTLISTETGKVITTLTMAHPAALDASGHTVWSPTGQQLAFWYANPVTVTIWGGAELALLPPVGT